MKEAITATAKKQKPKMKTLLFYAKHNPALGRVYLKANRVQRIEVGRHNLGEKGFRAWLMTGDTSGFPTDYKTKREAMTDAKQCADVFGLSIESA